MGIGPKQLKRPVLIMPAHDPVRPESVVLTDCGIVGSTANRTTS
jgi:hypothetical protein